MNDAERRLSTDTALQLLANRKRRQILRRMAEASERTTVDQLTQHLRGTGSSHPDDDGSVDHRIELHHVHLPMLRDANVVEYDANRGIVQRGPEFQHLRSLLAVLDDHGADTSTPPP